MYVSNAYLTLSDVIYKYNCFYVTSMKRVQYYTITYLLIGVLNPQSMHKKTIKNKKFIKSRNRMLLIWCLANVIKHLET